MTFKEKKLYHQIHPLKLFTDISSGFFTTYLLWMHHITWFLILFFLPSLAVSILLIKFANLDPLKESRLGRYLEKYMTPAIEAIRLCGQVIMWIAGWYQLIFLIVIGFIIIAGGWCNGLLFKRQA
ncbi:MAG TPA: hypothetical protein VIH57_05985 [Bacteroidales bacterium]